LQSYFSLLPTSLREREGNILPGVRKLIEKLSSQDGAFLGLLTGNFAEGARLKLQHYGLHHHFRMGGFGDEHLDRDDVARQALVELKAHLPEVAPSDVWVIGDTPSDVKCGRAIGANTVAVATGMFELDQLASTKPDVLLSDLTQAAQWLADLGL